jgi:ribonuclease R
MQQKNKKTDNVRVSGFVKRHPDGFGFLIPSDKKIQDLYVPKHDMNGVMSNDIVSAQVTRDKGRLRAADVRIENRETKKVTGQLIKNHSAQGLLKDHSFSWGEDLKVSFPPNLEVKNGDWVIVSITTYPDHVRGFQGVVETVLGDIENPENDNIRALASHNVPVGFSKEAIREAESLPKEVTLEDMAGRKNLRDKNFITIDGATAKDFDDAVYVEKTREAFHLLVAIADVSHYVKPGSAIDSEAYKKGTSTYFPNFVSPMLPEALSNELCSLKPKVPRLALVADMKIDFQGELKSYTFYEAVIESKARVTYGEAQEILDGTSIDKLRHVDANIKLASELAQILMKKRYRDGSLNLEIPETIIELDDTGMPTDILRSERLFAHKLIEELMLIANVAVAKNISEKNIPSLFRVHDKPKTEAIELLESYLENFGYKSTLGGKGLQKRITQALQQFSGTPQETILNILALRSMNQAQYSGDNIGHFGLGFSHYSHFTSPIRRYPDLIIHRLIKSVTMSHKGYSRMSEADINTAGTFLSACEQRSVKAERLIQAIKKARFMQKHLGEELEGIISSVTKFGAFVLLRRFEVDGLVKMEDLGAERFEFDEENLRLVAHRSGKTYQIGDSLTIQVARVDVQIGRIDFILPGGDDNKHVTHPKKDESAQKRRTPKNNRERVRSARVSGPGGKNKAESVRTRKNTSRRHK